jgi:hypothetical protein
VTFSRAFYRLAAPPVLCKKAPEYFPLHSFFSKNIGFNYKPRAGPCQQTVDAAVIRGNNKCIQDVKRNLMPFVEYLKKFPKKLSW